MTLLLYQLGDDAAFERCLPYTLKEEDPASDLTSSRNYSDTRGDAGGKTMDGITQREYDRWRIGCRLPTRWVRNIDPDEIRTIYHDDYWLPLCPQMPLGLNLCVFDTNVNNGVHAGKMLLQRVLGVTEDGIVGDQTLGAVAAVAQNPAMLKLAISRFYLARRRYYLDIGGGENAKFETDWLRRDLHIEQAALAMVVA